MFTSPIKFLRFTVLIASVVIISISQMSAGENRSNSQFYEVQSSTGQVIADTFIGTRLAGATTITPQGVRGWSLVGVADLKGTGTSLFYYEHSSGTLAAIFYSGTGNTNLQGYSVLESPGKGWTARAIADFNGDGYADVVFVNDDTGQVDVFFYGGAQGTAFRSRLTISGVSAAGWNLVGAADLDRDGHPDLILQNHSTGQLLADYLGGTDGTTVTRTEELGQFTGWTAAGMQNVNGHVGLVLVNDATGQIMVRSYGGALGGTPLGTAFLDHSVSPGWSLVVPVGVSTTSIAINRQPKANTYQQAGVPPLNGTASILLFNGIGTSSNDVTAVESILSAAGLAYNTVNSSQLDSMTQAQLQAYKLFLVPGGNSITIGKNLASKATANVRNAVANGLNYLGICAGGFFGGFSAYNNGLDLTSGVWFNFFADYYKGINKEAATISFPKQGNLDIYWQDGPELADWGYVVGKYRNGTPALAEGMWGKGFVLLSGVHPEAPASWRLGMPFHTPLQVDLAYATTLVKAALSGTMLPHF